MEVYFFSKVFVIICQTTPCHNPEENIMNFIPLRTSIFIEIAECSIFVKDASCWLESSQNFGTASINIYQTTRRHLSEDGVLHGHRR